MMYGGTAGQPRPGMPGHSPLEGDRNNNFSFSSEIFPIVSKIFDGQLSFYCERIALNRIFCREMI